jgi:hypothetical protein
MNLRITAFGQSSKLTIKERAEKVLELHKKFCDIVQVFRWKVYYSKTITINMQEPSLAYPEIFKQVKKGLNAKVANPIRYKENDIADITSNCWFYNLDTKSFNVQYSIGYPSNYFPSIIMTVENITNEEIFTEEIIFKISKLFIEEWHPYMLCVTDPEYFHKISKASELPIPWTGWFTYISNELKPLPKNIKFKTEQVNKGQLIWTTNELFNVDNAEHVKNALELESIFQNAGIRI